MLLRHIPQKDHRVHHKVTPSIPRCGRPGSEQNCLSRASHRM